MLHIISYQGNTNQNHLIPTGIKEKLEPLHIAGGNVESVVIWKTVWHLLKMLNIELSCGGGSDLATKLCQTLVTSWTMVHQASLSMGSRQEYWSGCHFLL